MKRLSLLTLIFAILTTVFLQLLVFLRIPFALYPLMSYQDALDVLTPLVLIPIYWLLFKHASGESASLAEELAFMLGAALWADSRVHLLHRLPRGADGAAGPAIRRDRDPGRTAVGTPPAGAPARAGFLLHRLPGGARVVRGMGTVLERVPPVLGGGLVVRGVRESGSQGVWESGSPKSEVRSHGFRLRTSDFGLETCLA